MKVMVIGKNALSIEEYLNKTKRNHKRYCILKRYHK